jgi:hypothetical protein
MSSVDFKSILSSLTSGDLSTPENSIWLVYAAVIVETIASASHITVLWKYIDSQERDKDKQLTIARRIRDGLLKTSPLAGFPRVRLHIILSLFVFQPHLTIGLRESIVSQLSDPQSRQPPPRYRKFWTQINHCDQTIQRLSLKSAAGSFSTASILESQIVCNRTWHLALEAI